VVKVVKKHKACASEFDYRAWKEIGEWRRGMMVPPTPSMSQKKDCWRDCDYPSECRWGTKEKKEPVVVSPVVPEEVPMVLEVPGILDVPDLVGAVTSKAVVTSPPSPMTTPTAFEALVSAINQPGLAIQSLLSRKKSTQKSPLKLETVPEEDEDGDSIMEDVAEVADVSGGSTLEDEFAFEFEEEEDIGIRNRI
jgi:hypothetical protein